MNRVKLRKFLILAHLLLASFMAPVFIILAVSGGLYLIGNEGEAAEVSIILPVEAQLDFKSPTLDDDVRVLFKVMELEHQFEYIKNRGDRIQTRPTSKPYIELSQTPDGMKAVRKTPNLQLSLMELHKGHGPRAFTIYQKLVAIGLCLSVLSGLFMGMVVKTYRRKTFVTFVGGAAFFVIAAYMV